MIDETEAWNALEHLRETQKYVRPINRQAREKAHMLKYVEALLVKGQANGKTPVTLQKDYARADDRYLEALKEDAEAYAELASLNESRETDRNTISLYQSAVKDRM